MEWLLGSFNFSLSSNDRGRQSNIDNESESTNTYDLTDGTGFQFYLYVRKVHSDAWTPFSLSSQKFLKEEWKNGADIYIVIHGFANTIKSPFITTTAAAIRNKMGDSVNIIGIDWGSSFNMRDSWGFAVDDYINAAFAISQVGAYAASLIAFLIENFKVNPSNITVIGHSLGGHVAHAISEHLQGVKIGRIFGLDLAGPLFSKGHQLQKQRLSKDDATMVAVLHTNGGPWYYGYLGLEEAVGHVDFYANGGRQQPGLGSIDSHSRAPELFVQAIEEPILAVSMESDVKLSLGLESLTTKLTTRGKFYFST